MWAHCRITAPMWSARRESGLYGNTEATAHSVTRMVNVNRKMPTVQNTGGCIPGTVTYGEQKRNNNPFLRRMHPQYNRRCFPAHAADRKQYQQRRVPPRSGIAAPIRRGYNGDQASTNTAEKGSNPRSQPESHRRALILRLYQGSDEEPHTVISSIGTKSGMLPLPHHAPSDTLSRPMKHICRLAPFLPSD